MVRVVVWDRGGYSACLWVIEDGCHLKDFPPALTLALAPGLTLIVLLLLDE